MKWTAKEESKALQLLKSGLKYAEIGKQLGRNGKSVKCKLNKMGYRYSDHSLSDYHDRCCENCKKTFSSLISTDRKFCSKSCSATVNNVERGLKNLRCCKNCSVKFKHRHPSAKYCSSKCFTEFERNIRFSEIEKGKNTQSSPICKKYLIHKFGEKCMDCGWSEVNVFSNSIPIELEHIDGNHTNNRIDNLKLLCPNCHSLTPTYRNLNKGNGRSERMKKYRLNKKI